MGYGKEQHILFRKENAAKVNIYNPNLPGLALVEINPTELCNRTCSFCPRSNPKIYPNRNLNMSVEVAQLLSDQLYEADYNGEVAIIGFGEPSLNKDILEIIKCFSFRFTTSMTTNGDSIMTGRIKLDDIVESNLSFLIVDCYDGDTHYHRMHNVLKKLDGRLKYMIRNTYDDGSSTIFEDYNFNNRGGMLGEVESIKRPCFLPMYKALIDWNGDALLCCNDWSRKEKGLGNINIQSFKDIWNSYRLNEIRKSLIKGDRKSIPACAGCNVDGCMVGEESSEIFKQTLL